MGKAAVPKSQALTKGKVKTVPKAKALTKGKGLKAKPATKVGFKKSHLAKLGKMTLAQKIRKAAEGCSTAEEAASNLKEMLSKEEHSKVWSKRNCVLKKKTKKEQKEFASLTKGEKGLQAALHMVKTTAPQFLQVKEVVGQSQTLDEREAWSSETEMITKFGYEEFQRHLESGRIVWRQDPFTWGVFNYLDKGDIVSNIRVSKDREWAKGQEYEPTEEDQDQWSQWWGTDSSSHLSLTENWGKGKALTKGKGKGKALTKGKGKGKGHQLALQNGEEEEEEGEQEEEEKPEEEQWKEVLAKAKKARDQCSSARADCEAAMQAADKAKRLTKQGKKETMDMLGAMDNKLKTFMAGKGKAFALEKAKALLKDSATAMKELNEESKELNQLAHKASSKAGSSKAGSRK